MAFWKGAVLPSHSVGAFILRHSDGLHSTGSCKAGAGCQEESLSANNPRLTISSAVQALYAPFHSVHALNHSFSDSSLFLYLDHSFWPLPGNKSGSRKPRYGAAGSITGKTLGWKNATSGPNEVNPNSGGRRCSYGSRF
jgi:hypothetical protein